MGAPPHRPAGGASIAIPFFYLLLKRRIRPALRIRLANLPILVALQGVMGWYMVQSGLSERTSVSAYRLTAHLALAIIIYVVAAWTAFRLHPSSESDTVAIDHTTPNGGALALATLVFVVILTGGFVAGLDAGLVYNTFPLMGGSVVPPTYGDLAPMWRNWFENPAAVQFHHRTLALFTLGIALWLAWRRRAASTSAETRRAWLWVQLAGVLQVTLGVVTLLLHVPISLAALHQVGAVGVVDGHVVGVECGMGRCRDITRLRSDINGGDLIVLVVSPPTSDTHACPSSLTPRSPTFGRPAPRRL
ncbi:MAG: COX15/CtaA family protein [Gemmatimonadetes bacterium]|nr:COX15/CtaA family protein [Gemmatimonadota bacterium]